MAAQHGLDEGEGMSTGGIRCAAPREDVGKRAGDEEADGPIAQSYGEREVAEELVAMQGGAEVKSLARGGGGGEGDGFGGAHFFGGVGDPGGGESSEIAVAPPHGIFADAAGGAVGEGVNPREDRGGSDRGRGLEAGRGIGVESVRVNERGKRPESLRDLEGRGEGGNPAGPGANRGAVGARRPRHGKASGEAGNEDRGIEIASQTSLGGDQRRSAGAADAREDAGALDRSRDRDALAVIEEARGKEVAANWLGCAAGARMDGAVARFAEVGAAAINERDGGSAGGRGAVIGEEDALVAVAAALNFGEERASPRRLDRAEDHRGIDAAATAAAVALEREVGENVERARGGEAVGCGGQLA